METECRTRPCSPSGLQVGRFLLALGLLCGLFPGSSTAADWKLKLNPDDTTISFQLGATFHTMEGTAHVSSGEIRFDPQKATVSGRIVVKAGSTDTGNGSRDKKMHQEILDTQRYPEIVLIPHQFTGRFHPEGESDLRLAADLDIHGAPHPVELDVHLRVLDGKLTGTASFPVPYVEWGMKDPSAFVLRVKKVVHVELVLAGTLSRLQVLPARPAPRH